MTDLTRAMRRTATPMYTVAPAPSLADRRAVHRFVLAHDARKAPLRRTRRVRVVAWRAVELCAALRYRYVR